MDIIHRPVFYLEHDVSETGFCLPLPLESYQLGPVQYLVSVSGPESPKRHVLNKRQDYG
jgi:hypothetical protein